VSEFAYLGDATVVRPQRADDAAAMHTYVYIRDNPAGEHRERWYHALGCRAWLDVTRHVRTHQVISVEVARPPAGGAA
jgi:sarcosine oxidase subunit delta